MSTHKQQQIIDRLTAENNKLRIDNARLKKAEAGTNIEKFAREKEQAILFAINAIESRTMNLVNTQMTVHFNIPPGHMLLRAFQDCLRMSMHMVDPRRAANLYNALALKNPNGAGNLPTMAEVEALLKEHVETTNQAHTSEAINMDITSVPRGPERILFIHLKALAIKAQKTTDTLQELQAAVQAAEVIPDHPASVFTLELAEAIDNAAADIGGSRNQRLILKDALDVFLPQETVQ